MKQILIVEDDIGLNQGLCRALKSENRQIISCMNLKTAREQLDCGDVSLVLLDINLPDGSGLDFLKELKSADPARPVILLTANDTDMDIVSGLEQGADDYITKPFSLSVLRARVNTQLRKAVSTGKIMEIDRFVFDFDRMLFAANGESVGLSKTEQKLLRLLVENQGTAMSRSDLIDRIWTDGAEYVDENALSVTIKRLRDKLGAQDYIQTVYGIGYTWGRSMVKWIVILALTSVAMAAVVIYLNYRRTKKTMDTISQMLDMAVEGTYSESKFDESRLSALETKFAHYLSSSAISARNVTIEKDKIKTLISDISHQTKTPIANLLLYSELIAEEELSGDMRSNVEAIQAQTEKLRFLIDSLVKLSRLENGILTLSPRREAVQPMLDSILGQYSSKARGKGLELQIAETTACASFDPKWTAEALGNLVDNAIKYTPTGSVTISAAEYELFTRIDVTDTGIGIAESEQPKIFSRFYRSEDARENEGVGIGLYLAREIISGEGGFIKLSSEPGRGSTFSVFLPR